MLPFIEQDSVANISKGDMSIPPVPGREFIALCEGCSESILQEYHPDSALMLLLEDDEPDADRLDGLRDLLEAFGSSVAMEVESLILQQDMQGLSRHAEAMTTHPMAMFLVAEGTQGNIDLHRLAAGMGYAPSLHCVGVLYEESGEENKDLVQAYRCYVAAAEKGYGPSMLNLGKLYLTGEMLSEGTGSAGGKARLWLERAAAKGSREATMLLTRF